jgi:hypothetical protein
MKKLFLVNIIFFFLSTEVSFAKCINGDCTNGNGTYIFSSIFKKEEVKYEGEFKNKKPHGLGVMTFPDSSKYIGEFKEGKQNGKGTLIFSKTLTSKGGKYIGEFKNGKEHGLGKYLYSDGSEFIGEFKDGKRNGKGTFVINGKKFTDIYKDGEKVK